MSADLARTSRWVQENEHELWPDAPSTFYNHKDCRVCGPGPLGRGVIPSEFPHVFYSVKLTESGGSYGYVWSREEKRKCAPEDATVVSSKIDDDTRDHTVLLDIDMPARLIESSTPGHYHLYIDKRLSWFRYRALLVALYRAGIIEKGFLKASLRRRATNLRPPWLEKS